MLTTTFPYFGGAHVVTAQPDVTVQLCLVNPDGASVSALLPGWRFTTPTTAADVGPSALVQGF